MADGTVSKGMISTLFTHIKQVIAYDKTLHENKLEYVSAATYLAVTLSHDE